MTTDLFQPRKYQLPLLRAFDKGIKRLVHVWHRKCGKDFTDLNIMIAEMIKTPGNYYYFFPTYEEAKKVIWEGKTQDGKPFLDYFPKSYVISKNDTEKKVVLKNGSIFRLAGTDDIDSLMGINPIGCVFSEFSLQQEDAWTYLRPILAVNGGWAIFNWTPRGRNHAWKLQQLAKQENNKWFFELLTVDDTQIIPQDVLKQEQLEMPTALFRQEYYCEYLEDAGAVFRGIDQCTYEEGNLPESEYTKLKWQKEKSYQLGVDLAKFNDFTVITPFDLNTFTALEPERFNLIDYNVQKARIEASYYRYNKARTFLDSTGVGEPIFDDLRSRNLGNLNAYQFTEKSRKDLLTNLQLLLEQRTIRIPNYSQLVNELKGFHYELTDTGKVKMKVPDNLHDDCVMSLALAVWDIPEKPKTIRYIEDKEMLKQFDFYKEQKQLTGSRYLRGH